MAEDFNWIDTAQAEVTTAMDAAAVTLRAVVADWRTIGALDDVSSFAGEDAVDRSKLVKFSDVIEEMHRMRDDILNDELPPVFEALWQSIEQWWGNLVSATIGWFDLLERGNLKSLYGHYQKVALISSPRSFIGRVNRQRRAAEQRLRRKALFHRRGEKRYLRKVAHRV